MESKICVYVRIQCLESGLWLAYHLVVCCWWWLKYNHWTLSFDVLRLLLLLGSFLVELKRMNRQLKEKKWWWSVCMANCVQLICVTNRFFTPDRLRASKPAYFCLFLHLAPAVVAFNAAKTSQTQLENSHNNQSAHWAAILTPLKASNLQVGLDTNIQAICVWPVVSSFQAEVSLLLLLFFLASDQLAPTNISSNYDDDDDDNSITRMLFLPGRMAELASQLNEPVSQEEN